MSGFGQTPGHAAVMELKSEQAVFREAYVFLDEKRLLLATELIRQLRLYQQLERELDVLHTQAREAMQAAVMHHGLDGLQVYPAASFDGADFSHSARNFMGVTLLETSMSSDESADGQTAPANPSGIAQQCIRLLQDCIEQSAVLAGMSGNLYRLLAEYRTTERRSRALENVILPEMEQRLREITSHLNELDLEDAIRVHLQSRRQE
ncbi:MAG: V-type ATP synthase subunit D [Pseudomonadota bacterium]